MTIKELKEWWDKNNIPDNTNINFLYDKKLSKDILDLIDIRLVLDYSEETGFSLACVNKNYFTKDEVELIFKHYESKSEKSNNN